MKKARLVLIATMLFAGPFMIKAQPCSNADDMMQVKGTWKKVSDWISPGSNFQEDMKPAIITRSDQIQRIIQAAYREPKGLQPQWRHEISGVAPLRSRLATYGLTTYLFQYYCHPAKHELALEDETSIFIEVHVNSFGRYMVYDTSLRVGRYYIALMFPRIGKLKDADVFQISLVRENERFIIVSRNGQLPYTPLTRKTYLTALRKKLQKEETRLMDNAVRFAKSEEARAHEMEYWKSHYDPRIAVIDDYLSRGSDTALNQIALVRDMQDFKKFYTEKEGGRMPVIVNADYFISSLSPVAPQFMLVYWSWDDGEGPNGGLLRPVKPNLEVCCKVSKYFKDSMEGQLDVQALQQLLDK